MSGDGEPLAQIRVTVTGSRLLGTRMTEANPQGFFQVLALPAGTFTVRLSRIGYRSIAIDSVLVRIGHTTNLGVLNLDPEAVPLPDVTISARAVSIDPATTTVGANIDAATYDALPVGRDYRSVLAFLPHANPSFYPDEPVNIAGATGLENAQYIDGVNVTNPHLNGILPVGEFILPYNFVRAVEVQQGGYDARYGRAIGGTTDAVTYSGGNSFEADVFGFFTNGTLTGTPRIGLRDVRSDNPTSYDVGGRVGGPILRDRLWYSFAYNPQVVTAAHAVPGWGDLPDRRRRGIFAGKLTWQAATTTSVEVLLFGDRFSQHEVTARLLTGPPAVASVANPDPYLVSDRGGHTSASLRFTHQLGAHGVLEGSVARATRSEDQGADTPRGWAQPTVFDYVTSTLSGGLAAEESPRDARTAVSLHGRLEVGAHSLIAGVEYEANRYINRRVSHVVFRLPTSWVKDSATGSFTVRNRVPTFYAGDSWRLSARLTVHAGLRWEGEYLYGSNGLAQSFPDEWQPRVGASYQVGRPGTQRLFGSFGIYYEQQPLDLAGAYYVPAPEMLYYYSADPLAAGSKPDSSLDITTYPSRFQNLRGAKVEHHREWTLGYEYLVATSWRLTARVMRRDLLSAFGQALDSAGIPVVGVPGQGALSFLPKFTRSYTAFELSTEWTGAKGHQASLSYVLSRTYGNYPGFYASDYGMEWPGGLAGLQIAEDKKNSTGLLPNDRTHVIKLLGAYRFSFGITAGTFLTWQSGTPRSELGTNPTYLRYVFLVPRGSVGRTPAIWDLNFRFALPFPVARGVQGRATLDWLHVGNPRRPVWFEQTHYVSEDARGNPIDLNATYGQVLSYQPPSEARLGVELTF